ncbi:putative GMP synthase [Daphnia magna]|uniref:Putative GMP synthase n=1 Tax=Daphnia magna TaxID=35525 RepID=A0A162CPS2_9CRUS|nr:putative GMP synthase [Daphnia magna]
MFVKVADRTANDLNVTRNNLLLGQVALIPDLIESTSHMASSRADAIKTHNGSEMVRQLCIYGRLVQPLKGLRSRAGSVHRITRTLPVSWSRFVNSNHLCRRTVYGS